MWKEENNRLTKEFIFKDFKQAIAFILQTAMIAEKLQHHPDLYNSYNKVTLSLTTHDSGNHITGKDRKFAEMVDQLDLP